MKACVRITINCIDLRFSVARFLLCFVIQQYVDHLKVVCKEGGCTLVPVYLRGSQDSSLMSVSVM